MIHYVSAGGWWVSRFYRNWSEDVTDGPDTPAGTVLGTVSYGDWEPVVMWRVEGEDHSSAVPLIVEDGSRVVAMGTHVSGHRELFYVLEYSPGGKPAKRPGRDIIKD